MTRTGLYPMEFKILDFLKSAQITTARALPEILTGLDTPARLAVHARQIIVALSRAWRTDEQNGHRRTCGQ